jgi:hypothetical protein
MTVPIRTFTTQEILTGNRNTKYYLDILDDNDVWISRLDGVTDGSLDFVANAMVKGGGSLTVRDVSQSVDWLNQRFRPTMAIQGLPEQPLGVFVVSEAPESWDSGRSWAVKLLDKSSILDQDIITTTYTVAAGSVITDAIITIIDGVGLTRNIVASSKTLVGSMVWLPGTSKLRIINDLLGVLNYFSLYMAYDGTLIGEPYVLPQSRPIAYEFLDGVNAIYQASFNRDYDIWKIPNRVVITGQGDGTTAALTSSIDNTSTSSPYSIANRGRVIGYTEEGVEAADQATLDAYARRRLNELTTPTSGVEIAHAPLPGLAVNNVVRFRRALAGIDATHTVSKTTITLKGDALAVSTLREVVNL